MASGLLEEILRSVEIWLKMMKKPEPYIDSNLDPVLLVPGIAGSILHATDEDGRTERVWVRLFEADYKFRTKLWSTFDPATGESVSLDKKSKVTVPQDRYGLHAIDCLDPDMVIGRDSVYYFHDMIVQMIQWGYQEGTTLFGFGYDFRQTNRFQETLDRFAAKLESVYSASGGKKINIISHSMGGLLVKCFMGLHSDIFEKYVKNWIAIAAPFRGAPGYITSTFLNGVSFVDGWEQNFFVRRWSMHQLLIECPSIYELMSCPNFHWDQKPLLEIWMDNQDSNGNSDAILKSYGPEESISIFKDALSSNTVHYEGVDIALPFNVAILELAKETRNILSTAKVPPSVKFYNIFATSLETPHTVCYGSKETPVSDLQQLRYCEAQYVFVDGDGTVPTESAKADGLNAEARVGVPGEHRRILSDHHVFRILKQWLNAGEPDPYYNPLIDYVILPTTFETETHQEKGVQVTSLKEEWEIMSEGLDELVDTTGKPFVSSISVSRAGDGESSGAEALATVTVHPKNEGKHHVELNATSVSAGA